MTASEKEAARAEISKAISAYASLVVQERSEMATEHHCENPECDEGKDFGPEAFVMGWVVALEYSNVALESSDKSGNLRVAGGGQSYATSLGLFSLAAREF